MEYFTECALFYFADNNRSVIVTINDASKHQTQGAKRSPMDTAVRWATQRAKRSCTRKVLYKRVPILRWLPEYTPQIAVSDLVAGITVGLTVIPQAIAYSNVAGVPPQVSH